MCKRGPKKKLFTLCLKATNMSGLVKHYLLELLHISQPDLSDIDRIVVCGYNPTLKELEDIPWLAERDPPTLDKGLLQPMLFLRY